MRIHRSLTTLIPHPGLPCDPWSGLSSSISCPSSATTNHRPLSRSGLPAWSRWRSRPTCFHTRWSCGSRAWHIPIGLAGRKEDSWAAVSMFGKSLSIGWDQLQSAKWTSTSAPSPRAPSPVRSVWKRTRLVALLTSSSYFFTLESSECPSLHHVDWVAIFSCQRRTRISGASLRRDCNDSASLQITNITATSFWFFSIPPNSPVTAYSSEHTLISSSFQSLAAWWSSDGPLIATTPRLAAYPNFQTTWAILGSTHPPLRYMQHNLKSHLPLAT